MKKKIHTHKHAGFTLAEVLITLAIIGVVAALTIPTLITGYKEKQTVTHLTKTFAVLSHACQMMQAEYGTINTWGLKSTQTGQVDEDEKPIYDLSAQKLVAERIKKYLKISKKCKLGEVCYPGAMYSLDGVKRNEANKIVTTEGDTPVEGRFFLQDGTYVETGWCTAGGLECDISVILSTKNDAYLGENRFFFVLTPNGLLPKGMKDMTKFANSFENGCNAEYNDVTSGQGCTAWVIYNKNMDYLHCREKLSWEGAHSCKE